MDPEYSNEERQVRALEDIAESLNAIAHELEWASGSTVPPDSESALRGKIDMPELQRDLEALLGLVKDPHPGLLTWCMMFYERGLAIASTFSDGATLQPDIKEDA